MIFGSSSDLHPWGRIQAVQPVQQSFDFEGYCAHDPVQDPVVVSHFNTRALGDPVLYQQLSDESPFFPRSSGPPFF